MLSRISGYGRDVAMTSAFGICPSVAALFVAFRLSNLLRRIVAEGPFQSIFIPYFEELRTKGEKKAHQFFKNLIGIFLFSLIGISLLVEVIIFWALSYGSFSAGTVEILQLSKWLFPSIIFICLFGLNQAFLSCYGVFFVPSLAPIFCNLFWILGVAFSFNDPAPIAMLFIAKSIFIGYTGQWLCTLPQTIKRLGWGISFSLSKGIKKLFVSFLFGGIGVGAMQLNVLADTIFARLSSSMGPGYLWYSIRMQQLVVALLGIAIVTTVTPSLSRAIKRGNKALAESLLFSSIHRIFILMLPCTFMIFAVAPFAINLLYGRGAFTSEALVKTSYCLWAYGIALVPVVMVVLFTAYFFSLNKVKTPTFISLLSVALNVLLNGLFVLILDLGVASVAFSTAVCAWVNFILLYKYAKNEELTVCMPRVGKLFTVCIFTFLSYILVEPLLFNQTLLGFFEGSVSFSRSVSQQIWEFCSRSSLYMVLIGFFGLLLQCKDLLQLLDLFRPRRKTSVDSISL